MRYVLALLLAMTGLLAMASFAQAAEENLSVLGKTKAAEMKSAMMMQRYLEGIAHTYLKARGKAYEAIKTPEDARERQATMRAFFEERLGGFPERTPLKAQIVGEGTLQGCRYQKIIYQSRPGFFVTAALFLPKTEPPYPGILVPCGHSANGKACEAYQRACILLAQHGMAALIFDPIGQGERYYFFDENKKPIIGTTLHHTLVGGGAILTGQNVAQYFIWDGMRGIDYLQSRDDIDPERIGCTGNSGGGTQTSYIMALEPRVACAAPSCYLTSFERLLATIGPQDAEQDIFGQVAFGMDHADYITMRAPKPTLICAATHDFFDIDGVWDTYREAKRFYTRLGYAERVDLIEVDDKHGFSQPRREAAVQWMKRWLLGIDEKVHEPDFSILTDQEIQCTPEGQVIWLEDARSGFDLNMDRAKQLAPSRKARWRDTPRNVMLERVRARIGVCSFAEAPVPEAEEVGTMRRSGYKIQKRILHPEAGIALPALLYKPARKAQSGVLYCHGDGKTTDAGEGGAIEALVNAGHLVLAVDLRGIGETQPIEKSKIWREKCGVDWRDFFRAYLVGKTYVGMRTQDIFACVKHLRGQLPAGAPIDLIAVGQATVPALHAAALSGGEITTLTLRGGIPSWTSVVHTPRAKQQLINCVHGALEDYDLPDLARVLGAARVTTENPYVPAF